MSASTSTGVDLARIRGIFRSVDDSNLPGVAVGIARAGVPVLRQCFGLASAEQPCLLTSSTRMRIASITKQFTCLAYLLLCERGVADFHAEIGDYLPEVHERYQAVAVRHVMSHVSGIRDAQELFYQFGTPAAMASADAVLRLYRGLHGVNFPPAEQSSYNNGGYVLLSLIIERLSGRSFADFLREAIFVPIGMNDTLVQPSDLDILERRATPSMLRPDGRYQKYIVQGALGEGGILSTVDDLLRWLAHMDSPAVGSPETWKRMRSKQLLANGSYAEYGFGLALGAYRGRATIAHSGGYPSCNAYMVKVPADGLDVIVLANRSDISSARIAYDVIDACISDVDAGNCAGSVRSTDGTFVSPTSGRVLKLSRHEDRQLASIDGLELEMLFDSDGALRLLPENGPFGVIIHSSGGTNPDHVELTEFGRTERFQRHNPVPEDIDSALLGRYQCCEADITALITRDDSGLTLTTSGVVGSKRARLRRIAALAWQAEAIEGIRSAFVVTRSPAGDRLQFRSIQTRDLVFNRVG